MSEKLKLTGVCIKGLKHPINITIADGSSQATVATVNVFAIPPLGFTGPDIGNFTEILHRLGLNLDSESLTKVAAEVKRIFSSWARIEASFVLFLKREDMARHLSSPMRCQFTFEAPGDAKRKGPRGQLRELLH
ncbi:MAG: GTP cyclohydrolase I FolE2 [Candidatus Brockarchaeota archaeon]|nr:GTP cyclohydrolase I FolE2 [Candidatus Brockarchaeota archaeon]